MVETDDHISKVVSYSTLLYELLCVQYATGYSAAQSLSHQILTEGQPAVERYINEFLKKVVLITQLRFLRMQV